MTRAEKEGELAGEAGGGGQQTMHGLGPHSGFWSLTCMDSHGRILTGRVA